MGPSACSLLSYCIVSAARCAVLEQVSSLPLHTPSHPIPLGAPLLLCTDSRPASSSVFLSPSILPPTSPRIARPPLSRPSSLALPRYNSCSFHCELGEPPNSPVNRPREATIVKPPPRVEILWNFISVLFRCYRDERASLQRHDISLRQRISEYDLHNRIIRQSLSCHITNVFINQLRFCMRNNIGITEIC